MQLDGVAGVGIAGNRDDEIWVIIDPSIISAKKISTNEIITALRNNIRDLPGGIGKGNRRRYSFKRLRFIIYKVY